MPAQRPADGTRNHAADLDGLDYFPTPPWATRALLDRETFGDQPTVLEPAAGGGHMAEVLRACGRFAKVVETDIRDHDQRGIPVADFLTTNPVTPQPDWVITNPPFRAFVPFVRRAITIARSGVAMFARLSAIEGARRHNDLWQPTPPHSVWAFSERVALAPGRLADRADTAAIAFAWFIWRAPYPPDGATRLRWIPPGSRDAQPFAQMF